MMGIHNAVLIDITSIQKYIFNSNKLKPNIGASFIIENEVFGNILNQAIENTIGYQIDLEEWEKQHSGLQEEVNIAYIGGGNALLLFTNPENIENFIRNYSRTLLITFPGLTPAFATGRIELNNNNFRLELGKLRASLKKNKQTEYIKTTLFKTGITEDCSITGEMQEFQNSYGLEFSGIAKAKYEAFDRAKKEIDSRYEEELEHRFEFASDFSHMGVDEEKGYIAVVHVDGNSMGKKFMNCQTLQEFRKLSSAVKQISREIMGEMVTHIVSLIDKDKHKIANEVKLVLNEETGKYFLPFRPIISGGDDFTFVCEGRLGVYLAEKLMSFFKQKHLDTESLSSCAGVAIVKAKYPFFRAYKLCEQLTDKAKEMVKSNPAKNQNALHFVIAGSGFLSEDYDEIVKQQFMVNQKKQLLNGPYYLTGETNSIENLKRKMYEIRYGSEEIRWPKNKIKELRNVLTQNESQQKYFIETLKARGLNVKDITEFENDSLWKKDGKIESTPLYDIFELLNFYPEELLKQKKLVKAKKNEHKD